uniref:DNA-directed RNA polymerase subunit n=1 Tax=Sinocyclocheilus rhinocerous TaxID=307959 RepID=A0A673FR69_9TELE
MSYKNSRLFIWKWKSLHVVISCYEVNNDFTCVGSTVSLGFFDDIIIPPESLQQPAKFDEAEQVWMWEYETDEGAHDLYMDQGEEICFRVVDEVFIDTSPSGPSAEKEGPSAAATAPPAGAEDSAQQKEAPYTLIVRILDLK